MAAPSVSTKVKIDPPTTKYWTTLVYNIICVYQLGSLKILFSATKYTNNNKLFLSCPKTLFCKINIRKTLTRGLAKCQQCHVRILRWKIMLRHEFIIRDLCTPIHIDPMYPFRPYQSRIKGWRGMTPDL
jgi:hypothetical protein